MTTTFARRLAIAFAVVVLAGLSLQPVRAQVQTPQRQTPVVNTTFVANVFNLGDLGSRAFATTLRVHVDQLTPETEAARLTSILRVRGERTLENELAKRDVGYLQIDSRLPERLAAAFLTEVDGERHLVLITERTVSPREIWRNTRSADYRFRVIELTLDDSGHGGGNMLAAARFRIEKDGTLGARNLGFIPWRVLNLRALEG